ncbi:MAG: lipoate--protein ligase family protein [Endomicrobiales bacterium]|nr:lipoate--protein ligase family protein [Endomicrobiales bacterium]
MKTLRFILSERGDGPENMAMDEALFIAKSENDSTPATLRLYTWNAKCVTIGYFQKYEEFARMKLPVTRRMTGGLSVVHDRDLSYSFIANSKDCPFVYDQLKTYEIIHTAVKKAFEEMGEQVDFAGPGRDLKSRKGALCVESFFPHDLVASGKKVLGSCQRRRGRTLLQQGSIHFDKKFNVEEMVQRIMNGFRNVLGADLTKQNPTKRESESAGQLRREKYHDPAWNRKF